MTERAKRPSRKELRQPDEFITLSRRTIEWGRAHPRELAYAGGGLVAVLVIAGLVSWYYQSRDSRAERSFYVGTELYQREQWGEALDEFSQLTQSLGSTPYGRLGRIYAARAAAKAGKPEQAITFYREYLSAGPPSPALEQLSRLGLASALVDTGDAEAARQELERAMEIDGPARPEAVLALARVEEARGGRERALELYQRYLKDDPNGASRSFVRDRVIALGGTPPVEPGGLPPGFMPPQVRVQ